MKHEELMTERDHADLAEASRLVEDGKSLRKRVFSRVRARAFRRGTKGGQETTLENPA